jgi:3-isopropylmalate/(R)-2-methylmalate dehydratase small subunit
VLAEDDLARFTDLAADPANSVTIDLSAQRVSSGDVTATFDIDPHIKERLLNGWDQVDITLQSEEAIAAYESTRPRHRPRID